MLSRGNLTGTNGGGQANIGVFGSSTFYGGPPIVGANLSTTGQKQKFTDGFQSHNKFGGQVHRSGSHGNN